MAPGMQTAKPRTRSGSSRSTPRAATYRPPDPEKRWRPRNRRGKVCGYTLDDKVCAKRGAHYCEPRADRVVAFFAEILVHTKGVYARRAFVLEPWQEWEIIRPLFGEVVWHAEFGCYARRYSVAGVILGRKNGKSELAAGIALYLLVGDDEEGAEVYGAAKDTKQAGKVWEPAKRMSELSSTLSERLATNVNSRRIFDASTASYYEVITSDAEGELGHNPHGFVLDELLSQADGSLWDSMITAEATRLQALFVLISTETNRPESFGAKMIDELERIEEDPSRAPHIFAFVRKTPRNEEELQRIRRVHRGHPYLPVSLDVWDERNWRWANPALHQFMTIDSLRKRALEARNDPTKENGFRQFRLNQRVSQATRWMPLHLWDAAAGMVDESALVGRPCFAGLDLASTTDLAAWVLLFPPEDPDGIFEVLWRFWTPERQLPALDRYLGGEASVWAREGWLGVTEGDWIDYWGDPANAGRSSNQVEGVRDVLAIHPQIEADKARFNLVVAGYDQREATATAQFMADRGIHIDPIYQGFALSPALKEMMRLVKADKLRHGGHPVARWCADSAEVRSNDEEKIKLVKPERARSGARVDGFSALATAMRAWQRYVEETQVVVGTAPAATGTDGGSFFRPGGRLDI